MTSSECRLSSPIVCGHCNNLSPMKIVSTYSNTQITEVKDSSPWEAGNIFEILLCPSCNRVSLRTYYWNVDMETEDEITYKYLYPISVRLPLGLPEAIKRGYDAALKVRHVDSNAFGVLIGRTIEMVCEDRGAKGLHLGNRLSILARKGEIPTKLVGIAKALARLRNVGAHPTLGELTPDEVPIVDDLCRALLDYVYNAPFLAQKAEDTLKALQTKRKRHK